jgi:hypothetical protein
VPEATENNESANDLVQSHEFELEVGPNRDAEGLGFEYGWRAEYDFAKPWSAGVEMFGEIEDLSNAGSFNDQNHSIGPILFLESGRGGGRGREDRIQGRR